MKYIKLFEDFENKVDYLSKYKFTELEKSFYDIFMSDNKDDSNEYDTFNDLLEDNFESWNYDNDIKYQYKDKLSITQMVVLRLYSLHYNIAINKLLQNKPFNGDLKKSYLSLIIKIMDTIFDTLPTIKNTILYRIIKDRDYQNVKVGDILEYKEYLSTSYDYYAVEYMINEERNVILKMKTNKGVPIEQWSTYPDEKEVLLPRNMKFKVTEVDYDEDDDLYNISLEEI